MDTSKYNRNEKNYMEENFIKKKSRTATNKLSDYFEALWLISNGLHFNSHCWQVTFLNTNTDYLRTQSINVHMCDYAKLLKKKAQIKLEGCNLQFKMLGHCTDTY